MEHDISQTLPSLRLFEAGTGPLHEDLKNVLMAFAFVRADEASQREGQSIPDLFTLYEKYTIYVPGTASLAAMLLLNMTPAQALLALMNLISSKPWLKAMYKLGLRQSDSESRSSELLGYDRVFNALLAERMPEIYANLHKMNIRPLEYLHGWIQTLFVPWLEIDTVSHLWDIIFLDEGEATLFRIALAVMELLEPRLYVRERDELLSVLHGTNPAAIRIWRRESGSPDDQTPPRDQIYVQYMLTEQGVFRCLYAQDVWWKDLTLQRLLDRELNR
ncbi:hypothetical protein MEQU1_002576 [Malassezia equina]|uniref:Rab-GAP TBC domain-containing protein n=1 Tax=Malassezia equina TaxID=1381935 RepID=A0AAF0EKP6_9BASI|nr:hypothetical protein MEQU1_002576 [Malassezia equina]